MKRLGLVAIVFGIIATLTVARPAAAYDLSGRLEVEDPGVARTPNEVWHYVNHGNFSYRTECGGVSSGLRLPISPVMSSVEAAKARNIIFTTKTSELGDLTIHGYRDNNGAPRARGRVDGGPWVTLDYTTSVPSAQYQYKLATFPAVPAGNHQLEVEPLNVQAGSGWQVWLDYIGGKVVVPHAPGCPPQGSTFQGAGIQTPEIDCSTEYLGSPVTRVRLRAKIGNPQLGATDAVTVETPWAAGETVTPGGSAEFLLPDPATKPVDGWVGTCRVKRTVNLVTHRTSNVWKTQAGGPRMVDDVPPELTRTTPKRSSGQVITLTESPTGRYIYVPDGTGKVPAVIDTPKAPVGRAPPAGGLSIPSAAAVGWMLGGAATGVFGEVVGWTGDDEWFCRWNPGYKGKRQQYCSDISSDSLELRNQIQLKDESGSVVTETTTTPWQQAEAIAETNIDPAKPDVGIRTTTGVTLPAEVTNPDRQASLDDVLSPDQGTARAEHQVTGGSTSTDTRTPGVIAPAPPGQPPGTGECALSVWGFLNPLNIAESIGCVLRRLFIPKAGFWSTALGGITQLFPINIINETVQVGDTVVDRTNLMLDQSACASFDYSKALGGDDQYLNVKLPTPSSYGCPQNVDGNASESTIGDLYGYRSMFRNLLRTLLYIGFGLQVVRSFQPSSNEMDPEPSATETPRRGYENVQGYSP